MTVLGIDIGGSSIKYAPIADGALRARVRRTDTPADAGELLRHTADLIARAREEWNIEAAGIGIPGFIRSRDGVIVRSPNLQFLNGVAFAAELSRLTPWETAVDNDANCAALGAWTALPEPRPGCLVHLTLGTGVGSGIIIGGRPWRGSCGFAAELGHLVVHPGGRACGCGGRGCAETEASETGIMASWKETRPDAPVSGAREIHELLEAGDPDARATFDRAGRFLGVLLTNIVNCLNPDIITIGGGVAAAGNALLAPAREEMQALLHPHALACTRIQAEGYENAGILGAAGLIHKDSKV